MTRLIGEQSENIPFQGRRVLSLTGSAFCCFAFSLSAQAVSIGDLTSNSYIGQPLNAQVRLDGITSISDLDIAVSDTVNIPDNAELSVETAQIDGQTSILLKTVKAISEPYLSFSLQVNEDGATVKKDFTLLMDMPSVDAPGLPLGDTSKALSSGSYETLAGDKTQSIMGPYDWAERGAVPQHFGPVLDGQSLWRVARRINKALGVSIEQMMVALFKANPDAFSNGTVESLKAGAILRIPSVDVVTQYSSAEVTESLSQSSLAPDFAVQQAQPTAGVEVVDAVDEAQIVEQNTDFTRQRAHEVTEAFQLSNISDLPEAASTDENSQKIITSLAATVGNLTQELIRKDKRIEFLQEKVEILEKLQRDSSVIQDSVLPADPSSELNDDPDSVVPETAPQNDARLDFDQQLVPLEAENSETSFWAWLLGGLVILLGLVMAFRDRALQLVRSLNLFGAKEEVSFSEHTASTNEYPVEAEAEETDNGKDFSTLSAVKAAMRDAPAEEDFAYIDYYPGNDQAMDVEETDLHFDERFNQLLEEHDYQFAKELLDFARNNEISEHEFVYYKLKLLQTTKDEKGFYDYYYSVEAGLPEFNQDIQTRISSLLEQAVH